VINGGEQRIFRENTLYDPIIMVDTWHLTFVKTHVIYTPRVNHNVTLVIMMCQGRITGCQKKKKKMDHSDAGHSKTKSIFFKKPVTKKE
jgi:hypothetical protein